MFPRCFEVLVRDWLGEAPEDRELQRLQEILEVEKMGFQESSSGEMYVFESWRTHFCSSGSHVLVISICNFVDWRCCFDEEVKRFVNDVIPFELIQMCVP